jgi:hypothetical protein
MIFRNKNDFKFQFLNFEMSYFGIEDLCEELKSGKNSDFSLSDKGFGCQTENCKNREAKCCGVFLPHCNENPECMKRNLEYMISQNFELRGTVSAYHSLLPKTPHPSLDRMDEGF